MQSEILDALALTRTAAGARSYIHVDQALLNEFSKNQSTTGLVLYPWRDKSHLPLGDVSSLSHVIDFYAQARALIGISNYDLMTGKSVLSDFNNRMLDGLLAISYSSGDQLSFGPSDRIMIANGYLNAHALPNWGWLHPYAPPAIGTQLPGSIYSSASASGISGMAIQGAAQYYARTGDQRALRLARGYTNYMRSIGFFGPNGEFLEDGPEAVPGGAHFPGGSAPHSSRHTKILDSMADLAIATSDTELISFIRKSFEWARDHQTSDKVIGYFPEFLTDDSTTYHAHAETDELAEMIAIATKISRAGYADYWEDVDRWVRNHFSATQVTSRNWIDEARSKGIRATSSCPLNQPNGCKPGAQDINRFVGTWPGWSTPNDWIDTRPNGQGGRFAIAGGHMACCTASAGRTIALLSENIVTKSMSSAGAATLKVNLLLNKGTHELNVRSHIPYSGQVDMQLRSGISPHFIEIRKPEWIPAGYTGPGFSLLLDGQPISFIWKGNYITTATPISENQVLSLRVDIPNRDYTRALAGTSYTFTIRGTSVVKVLPVGPAMPLYNEYTLQANGSIGAASTRVVERFVHNKNR